MNRLLKMGGELYVECETNPTETNYYPDDTAYRLDASNFLIPTPEYLNADMKRNGFEIVEVFRTKKFVVGIVMRSAPLRYQTILNHRILIWVQRTNQ